MVYAGVALLLLGPLLLPGFILTLDMVFAPQLRLPADVTSSYLLHAALHVLGWLLPADMVQKLLLFIILVLAGLGAHRLARSRWLGMTDGAPVYTTGLLYMVNPFTYERFIAGQYNVLFGYALLPWLMLALLVFVSRPGWRTAVGVAGWLLLISIVSIHSIVPAAIIVSLFVARQLVGLRGRRPRQLRLVKYVALLAAGCLVGSSYWLIPLAMGNGSQAELISSFSLQDRQAFATVGDSVAGRLLNVLHLQGLWAEKRVLFVLPQAVLPMWLWGTGVLFLWGLVIIGSRSLWRRGQRGLLTVLLACVGLGAVLGAGFGNAWFAQLPLLAGYREPQKFVMLVALGYALLAGFGLAASLAWAERRKHELLSGGLLPAALLLPFVVTPCFMWAANGQLQAADYPAGWYAINQRLVAERSKVNTINDASANNFTETDARILFLPWHSYLHTNFAGRIIANPAPKFFDVPLLVSGDPELGGAAYDKPTAASRQIDAALKQAKDQQKLDNHNKSFTAALESLNIQYVVLAKESDYQQYAFLRQQTALQLIADYKDISLYRVQDYQLRANN